MAVAAPAGAPIHRHWVHWDQRQRAGGADRPDWLGFINVALINDARALALGALNGFGAVLNGAAPLTHHPYAA